MFCDLPNYKRGGSTSDTYRRTNPHTLKQFFYILYVLLTVHLSTILVINQLNAPILVFLISLLYASTSFEHCCAHHQEGKIVSSHSVGGRPLRSLRKTSLHVKVTL